MVVWPIRLNFSASASRGSMVEMENPVSSISQTEFEPLTRAGTIKCPLLRSKGSWLEPFVGDAEGAGPDGIPTFPEPSALNRYVARENPSPTAIVRRDWLGKRRCIGQRVAHNSDCAPGAICPD